MKNEMMDSGIAEIEKLEARLIKAIAGSDITILDELLDDQLVFVNHLGMDLTKQEDLAPHRNGDLKISSIGVSDQEVRMFGDTAIVKVSKVIQGSYLNEVFEARLRFTRVWKLSGQRWRVITVSSVLLSD